MPTTTSPDDFEFDVFISYSSKDEEWVRGELLRRIEDAGLKAFIDFRDFKRGAPSIKECERGVEKCRKTLVVLTPNYLASGWAEFENIMVQTLDPANESLRLIPLLKVECKKPLRIGALTHIDFTDGADLDLGWRQLLTALGAPPEPVQAKEPKRDDWYLAHPYPMPPNFTGRVSELKMLSNWLGSDDEHPLLVLRALGGFGKSALAWHWLLHDVSPADWPRVVWWSFYEGDASFDNFLARTVEYLSGKQTKAQSLSAREQSDRLIQLLHQSGSLLVLDGFERVLRIFGGLDAAYRGDATARPEANDCDCIYPLAEGFLRSLATLPGVHAKILMTTRLCPHVLEVKGGGLLQGCREEELLQMEPDDAVSFFHAQGIRGTRTEIETACAPYGFHPLSLRLLAGLIVKDFQQPGDIAAAQRLGKHGDIEKSQQHLLESSYDSLADTRRALLSRIACFRSPVKYEALKALAETGPDKSSGKGKGGKKWKAISVVGPTAEISNLDADLQDLVARGLLHHDKKESRFDLHPIVRRYAYDRLAAPDRAATHTQLRDYFAAVQTPDKVTRLDDLAPVIELYHHTVSAGQYDEACKLLNNRLVPNPLHFQFGAYHLMIELKLALFPDGEEQPPRLESANAQAWTLHALANSYGLSGQPRHAVPLLEAANEIDEQRADKQGVAIGLGSLAQFQMDIGKLRAAEANLRRRIQLCQEIENEFREQGAHRELGRLLCYRGTYAESETELTRALKSAEKQCHPVAQGIAWSYLAVSKLIRFRTSGRSEWHATEPVLEIAHRVLELANEWARLQYSSERDYVRAHWILGAVHCVAHQGVEAECHLNEALERCRRISAVDSEPDILIDLARLRAATGKSDEAQRFAEEALIITERSGYVLQGADAHLELAKLALARGDKGTALGHAKEARKLATCDGPPDYTYKVAYDEAGALLKELGEKI